MGRSGSVNHDAVLGALIGEDSGSLGIVNHDAALGAWLAELDGNVIGVEFNALLGALLAELDGDVIEVVFGAFLRELDGSLNDVLTTKGSSAFAGCRLVCFLMPELCAKGLLTSRMPAMSAKQL
jgi:hypothetical protein